MQYLNIFVCVYVCMCIYMHKCTYVKKCTCTYMHLYVCVCVYQYDCMYVCKYVSCITSYLVIFSQVELNSNNKMLHADTLFPSFNDKKSAISFFTTLTLSNRSTWVRGISVLYQLIEEWEVMVKNRQDWGEVQSNVMRSNPIIRIVMNIKR
jgi:hypothetical protein